MTKSIVFCVLLVIGIGLCIADAVITSCDDLHLDAEEDA